MKLFIIIYLIGIGAFATFASANPIEKKALSFESDPIEYVKEYLVSFLDEFLSKDKHEISDIKVSKNSYRSSTDDNVSSRSDHEDYQDKIENYIKNHDVQFKVPILGAVNIDARNLDNNEIDFNINFGTEVQEARKSKLKKIFIPILVFVLLKAMTLVPLALGILSLKAWNALQLSFFSFVVSIGLAIFQLCKKIAADSPAPQIAAAEAWPGQPIYGRSISEDEGVQNLSYSAYHVDKQ